MASLLQDSELDALAKRYAEDVLSCGVTRGDDPVAPTGTPSGKLAWLVERAGRWSWAAGVGEELRLWANRTMAVKITSGVRRMKTRHGDIVIPEQAKCSALSVDESARAEGMTKHQYIAAIAHARQAISKAYAGAAR